MGSAQSNFEDENNDDLWWSNATTTTTTTTATSTAVSEDNEKYDETTPTVDDLCPNKETPSFGNGPNIVTDVGYSRSLDSREKLEILKKHLETKRVERQQIISEKKKEMDELRANLARERETNQMLREQINKGGDLDDILKENIELKSQIQQLIDQLSQIDGLAQKNKELQVEQASLQNELQSLNKQIIDYEQQKNEFNKHIAALKDIIKISKQMLLLRENELTELKQKMSHIEKLLADQEMSAMSSDLRREYEHQLRNIRNLRTLYEERARVTRTEMQNIREQLSDAQQKLEYETNKSGELQQRVDELEDDVSKKWDDICSLQSNLGLSTAECRGLKNEMGVINQLFAQFLLGFKKSHDLDNLVKILEENHDLLADLNGKNNEDATSHAFPRLLLNLINQIGDRKQTETEVTAATGDNSQNANVGDDNLSDSTTTSVDEIVANLPKVWRVLTELLSHQTVQPVAINQPTVAEGGSGDASGCLLKAEDPCYKSIETPAGTRYELSVSKTYIRLKDLIMEKKYLQKEMLKMKSLNKHLEERLQNQETRLVLVTKELSKTWHIVGRLQRQHEQLHTHEKILRYELSQKRKLLNELKEELEYCKEKWIEAREKNNQSESECQQLRSEFAMRRNQTILDEYNNSGESGYSDTQEEGDDDDESDVDDLMEKILQKVENKIPDSCNGGDDKLETDSKKTDEEVLNSTNDTIQETEAIGNDGTISNQIICSEENVHPTCSNAFEACEVSKHTIKTQETEKTPLVAATQETNNTVENYQREESMDKTYQELNIENESSEGAADVSFAEHQSNDIVMNEEQSNVQLTHEESERLQRREERLKRLEQHCQQLKTTYANQTERGTLLCNKLDKIHAPFKDTNLILVQKEIEHSNNSTLETNVVKLQDTDQKPIGTELCSKSDETPCTSTKISQSVINEEISEEERLRRREERFKRLEKHTTELKQKYLNQTERGSDLCQKLDSLHQQFGKESKADSCLKGTVESKDAEENSSQDSPDTSIGSETNDDE